MASSARFHLSLPPPPPLPPPQRQPISRLPSTRIRSSASMASDSTLTTNKKVFLVFENEEGSPPPSLDSPPISGNFTAERGCGSLVKALRKLVEALYGDVIEWGKWHIFWVEERVVPKDHPDSNYKLADDGFLSKYFYRFLSHRTMFTPSMMPFQLKALSMTMKPA